MPHLPSRIHQGRNHEPHRTTILQRPRKKLWTVADKLRSNLDAAVYKHVVLGLIFLSNWKDLDADTWKLLDAD